MQHFDGNLLAGALADLLSFDATAARARCNGCGNVGEIATAIVFRTAAGAVARCPACEQVLLTIVHADDRTFVNFTGTGAIEVPAR